MTCALPHDITYWLDVRFTEAELEIMERAIKMLWLHEQYEDSHSIILSKLQHGRKPVAELVRTFRPPQGDEPLEDLPL